MLSVLLRSAPIAITTHENRLVFATNQDVVVAQLVGIIAITICNSYIAPSSRTVANNEHTVLRGHIARVKLPKKGN
jgi:hypothetical protein